MLRTSYSWQTLYRDIDKLPTHRSVAKQIIDVAGAAGMVTLSDLESCILHDPAISASLLRLANSELFGASGRIATLGHAVIIVDIHLARVTSLFFNFSSTEGSVEGFDHGDYWWRSRVKSYVAGELARHFPEVSVDEAKVVGLVSDLGRLMMAESLGERYGELCLEATRQGRPLEQIECGTLGLSASSVAAQSFETWRFPKFVVDAVRCQYHPELVDTLPEKSKELAKVLCLASLAIDSLVDSDNLSRRDRDLFRSWTRMDEGSIDAILASTIDECEIVRSLYEPSNYRAEELHDLARKAMFQVSVSTAHALVQSTQQVQAHQRVAQDLKRQRDKLEQQVTLDPLLGIGNRRNFDTRLREELHRCCRNGQPLSLILFDLDHFKEINDTYMHQAGDETLKAVTRAIGHCLRSSDIFARYGGEEFGVICPETELEGARALAERMRQCLECLTVYHQDYKLRVTASYGVATVCEPRDIRSPDEIIEAADSYLFEAKRNGRNQVRFGTCPRSPFDGPKRRRSSSASQVRAEFSGGEGRAEV